MASRRRSTGRQRLGELVSQPEVRWIVLGYVMGAHGLRGALRVRQHNLDSDLLFELAEVATRRDGVLRAHQIVDVRETPKELLVQLEDVQSIDAAEQLKSAELCVPRELLPPLEPGEFYHVDLEGLPVITPDQTRVGVAERVHAYPAADVLVVRAEAGVWEVPMREPYFVDVDLERGLIVVDALEDLELEPDRNKQ